MRSAFATLLVIIGALLAPATAAADDPPFVVTNAASYQANPISGGAVWAIFTRERVSPEASWVYQPWTTAPHYGLWVEASCAGHDNFLTLPVLYVGFSYDGNQINVYKQNAIGSEPWGPCPYTGPATVRIHTASGATLAVEATVLPAHPGIFAVGDAPAGDHVDGSGTHTALSDCPAKLVKNPKACTVRTANGPSELWVYLTGAEWFLCNPCTTNDIVFELGPSPTAPDTEWVRQNLVKLASSSTGVEQAVVRLLPDTDPGVHYLRVRNTFRPEYPAPLRVELGLPA